MVGWQERLSILAIPPGMRITEDDKPFLEGKLLLQVAVERDMWLAGSDLQVSRRLCALMPDFAAGQVLNVHSTGSLHPQPLVQAHLPSLWNYGRTLDIAYPALCRASCGHADSHARVVGGRVLLVSCQHSAAGLYLQQRLSRSGNVFTKIPASFLMQSQPDFCCLSHHLSGFP